MVSHDGKGNPFNKALFQHPLEAHLLLSKLSYESSQVFINYYRQSMFAQVYTLCLEFTFNG